MTRVNRTALALAIAAFGLLPAGALARDPGPIDVRGRGSVSASSARGGGGGGGAAEAEPGRPAQPTYEPAALDTDALHGPRPAPRERRRLYEEVEEAVDRGAGRVRDEQTYEARRRQDDRDVRLGRVEPQREAERVEEEVDRRRRLDQQAERQRVAERGPAVDPPGRVEAPQREPTSIEATPNPGGSTLARFVAEQEALLTGAREQYQQDLAQAEADREAALAAGGSRAERAAARRRFEEHRSELTITYQQYRRKILGTAEPAK